MRRPALALALALAFALAWFGTLGLRPLYKSDESRYGEIPREMAASGDWVTPRLNGFKYFEKPPLQYWTTAAFFKVLGEKDWVARLWTALTGFLGIVLVAAAGNRLFGQPAGLLAAAILAGSPLYVLLGQMNTLDMGLTFFMSAAILAFAAGYRLAFWAACAAAVLSKGLVGIVLPGAAVALYVLIQRDWMLLRRLRIVSGGLVFLAIAAPWFVAVSLANEEFPRFFFIHEHFERFTSTVHQRDQPAWFFLPVLAIGMAPWVLPAAVAAVRSAYLSRSQAGPFNAELFLAIWSLVVFVFFSASGSKLPPYVLPMLPALALLAGRWLAVREARGVLIAQAALLAAAGAALAVLAPGLDPGYDDYRAWVPSLAAAGVLAAAASLGALAFAWRRAAAAAVALLALAGFGATQLALAGHRVLAAEFSVAPTVAALPAPPDADATVFAVEAYDHTMPWTLRRTVTMVVYKDELEQAIAWEPHEFIDDLPRFAQAWNAAPKAYAFIAAKDFDGIRERLGGAAPMEVAARGPRYVIVKKPEEAVKKP